MRVGICWQGSTSHKNDGMRSLPRAALAVLTAVQGVQWVSLARDAWTPAMGELGLPNGLAGCRDWADTKRVIERELDLVITVDTAIGHLAGGCGFPCWMLVARVPDFRWMLDRSDTPLYRSVRLYRQRIAGEWAPVMEQVAADLTAEVQARRMIA